MIRLTHQLIFTLATQWYEHTMQKEKDNSSTTSNNRDNSSYI